MSLSATLKSLSCHSSGAASFFKGEAVPLFALHECPVVTTPCPQFLLFIRFALFFALACVCFAGKTNALEPAFLDAADQVTVWMDNPVTAASLLGHVSVQCGPETIPVTAINAVKDTSHTGGVVLAGTFQPALGGGEWQTDDEHSQMTEFAPGVYQFRTRLPKGNYEYKVVRGGTWADSYGAGFKPGGANLTLAVPADNTPVLVQVNFGKKTIQTSLDTPGLAPFSGTPMPALSHTLHLTLGRRLGPSDIMRPLLLKFADGTTRPIFAREVLSGPGYFYSGGDLGAAYSHTGTTFKVWSPVSSAADLLLYPSAAAVKFQRVPMQRSASGVWSATVPGNLSGTYYLYRFTSYGAQHTAPDIYGRSASPDLQRSLVVDLSRTDPAGFRTTPAPALAAPTDAVVYEVHTRDFTVDPSSGVPAAERGTYVGVVAPGTHVPGTDQPTGLDYLRRLGVTHVHLLPFQSINPTHAGGYNWGYETDLFDVPEPRYAANPSDPASVIRDVKTLVTGLHRAHLGLVMDVVYNHTVPVSAEASPFWATVPYYYFRTNAQGGLLNESGVGNALDDDHPMVRKYVCDSLSYWAKEYRIDGFRFDLLGMFTPQTVQAISETLHALRPDILIYGEPWTGGGPTRFGKGAQRGLRVAVFNDNFRNLVRGDLNGTAPGFALGGGADPAKLQSALAGSPDFTQSPAESMNYVSIHDDRSLWDKITATLPGDGAQDKQALKLAGAMVLLSQGVPILEGGAEMGRTKGGNANSYNSGDAANRFDWARGAQFADVSDYYRGLIAVRQAHPAFRCRTADAVRQTVSFLPATGLPATGLPAKTAAFTLNGAPSGDSWARTLVIFHGGTDAATLTLPPGHWHLAVTGDQATTSGEMWAGATLPLAPLSSYVLYQER